MRCREESKGLRFLRGAVRSRDVERRLTGLRGLWWPSSPPPPPPGHYFSFFLEPENPTCLILLNLMGAQRRGAIHKALGSRTVERQGKYPGKKGLIQELLSVLTLLILPSSSNPSPKQD